MGSGNFSEKSLQKYTELCSDGLNFSEGNSYDFARCIKADGEIYGISPGEKCKEGKQISDKKTEAKGDVGAALAKLKTLFMKKIGREMTPKELLKAENMPGFPIPKGQTAEDVLRKLLPKGSKVGFPTKTA